MSNDPNELSAIDPAALTEVTGGLDDSDGKILTALQGIQDTIKSLGENNNNNNSWQQMLPFLLMAFSGSGSFSFGNGHFSGSSGGACGCGCGGVGACRRRR
jgi:hypothetical protein